MLQKQKVLNKGRENMLKYKLGDKVKVISDECKSNNVTGEIGFITELWPDMDCYLVYIEGRAGLGYMDFCMLEKELELIEKRTEEIDKTTCKLCSIEFKFYKREITYIPVNNKIEAVCSRCNTRGRFNESKTDTENNSHQDV